MLVAKRRLSETWRDAVARQATPSGLALSCLRRFDEELAGGESEAAAAFRALGAHGLLNPAPGPAAAAPGPVVPTA